MSENAAIGRLRTFGDDLPGYFNAAFWFGMLLTLIVVVLPVFPPLQDYWEWVYQGVLIDQMLLSPDGAGPFEFRDYPVPNSISQAMVALLVRIMPATWAAKAVILAYLALILLIVRSMRKLAPPETSSPAMMVLFTVLVGSQFFNGYVNNLFGNLLLLLYFTIILRRKPLILETFLFSFLLFFCHATSFAVFGMLVTVHVAWRTFRWQHLLALVPTGLMFLWYLAAKENYVEEGLVLSGWKDWLEYKAYTVAKLGPYHNFFIDGVGDYTRAPAWFWTGVVFNLAFAAFLGLLVLQVFVRNRLAWIKDPAFVCVAILLLAFPVMPTSVSGVVNIGERFLTIAVLLFLPLAVVGPLKWTLSFGGLVSLFILPVLFVFAQLSLNHEIRAGGSVPVLEQIDSEGRMEKLFWHRPFDNERRLEHMRAVKRDGLSVAMPLDFTTSLIAPEKIPETDDADGE